MSTSTLIDRLSSLVLRVDAVFSSRHKQLYAVDDNQSVISCRDVIAILFLSNGMQNKKSDVIEKRDI